MALVNARFPCQTSVIATARDPFSEPRTVCLLRVTSAPVSPCVSRLASYTWQLVRGRARAEIFAKRYTTADAMNPAGEKVKELIREDSKPRKHPKHDLVALVSSSRSLARFRSCPSPPEAHWAADQRISRASLVNDSHLSALTRWRVVMACVAVVGEVQGEWGAAGAGIHIQCFAADGHGRASQDTQPPVPTAG